MYRRASKRDEKFRFAKFLVSFGLLEQGPVQSAHRLYFGIYHVNVAILIEKAT